VFTAWIGSHEIALLHYWLRLGYWHFASRFGKERVKPDEEAEVVSEAARARSAFLRPALRLLSRPLEIKLTYAAAHQAHAPQAR